MLRKRTWVATLIFCRLIAGQAPVTQPKPDDPKPAEHAASEPPKKPVYLNAGKPIKVDFTCKDDDITSFGLTCTTEEVCEAYLELSNVESVGNRLFVTGNIHTNTTTLWSVLLSSEDGGKSWTEVYDRLRSTGLEHIQFFDFQNGWIGGQLLLALPRDPFLLITDDGGKVWRKRSIYSDSKVGAIEQFAFESKSAGQLLIDRTQNGESGGRHEFYETNSGGDSWSLRQVSPNPIRLKRTRVPNTDWRLRADARTKSFIIERKSGERWTNIASFLIRAGECKPADVKLIEPPTEEVKPEEASPPPPPAAGPRRPPTLKKKP